MASDTAGNVELPSEIWERILRRVLRQFPISSARYKLKALSLVCQLFRRICQRVLFEELFLATNVRMDYKNHAFQFTPLSRSPGALGAWLSAYRQKWPVGEFYWEDWERDLREIIRSEQRLALIGGHDFLAAHPRCLKVRGCEIKRHYPSDPFHRPSERQALSRAIFDARHRFRQTLLDQLPALTNLRRLELSNYPVDADLLIALDLHQPLTELRFDFCWFPKTTSPLTSITSLSFGQIPGSHIRDRHAYYPSYDPYKAVPDHHVASAFSLISPAHLEHLHITFGCEDSSPESVLKQLYARTATKGGFRRLHTLEWCFGSRRQPPLASMIAQFLQRTPALRKLSVQGYLAPVTHNTLISANHIPRLETLSCPFDWARILVPGRPVETLQLWLPNALQGPEFLALTEGELDDILRPLTLSTASITTLHLPHYPPVAPLRLLLPYLTAGFPCVRDLEVGVAGDAVAAISYDRRGVGDGPPMPKSDVGEQVVEGGLLELLEREVRDDVEERLATSQYDQYKPSNLPPVRDRVMIFKGLSQTVLEEREKQNTFRSVLYGPEGYASPARLRSLIYPTPSYHDIEEHEDPAPPESLLVHLVKYFGDLDSHSSTAEHEAETLLVSSRTNFFYLCVYTNRPTLTRISSTSYLRAITFFLDPSKL